MQITEILKLIHSLILKGTDRIIIIIFATFAFFLYCLPKIYNFFQPRKRRISELKELLNDENISGLRKRNIKNKIWVLQYPLLDRNVNIITNNPFLQAAILEIYEFANGRIKFSDFRIALPLLTTVSDRILKVDILKVRESKRRGYILKWVNIFIAVLFFLNIFAFLFLVWLLAFTENNLGQKDGLLLLISSLVVILFGCGLTFKFAREGTLLIPNARKIEKEIEKYKKAKLGDKDRQKTKKIKPFQFLNKITNRTKRRK